jgi:hypothetical protein
MFAQMVVQRTASAPALHRPASAALFSCTESPGGAEHVEDAENMEDTEPVGGAEEQTPAFKRLHSTEDSAERLRLQEKKRQCRVVNPSCQEEEELVGRADPRDGARMTYPAGRLPAKSASDSVRDYLHGEWVRAQALATGPPPSGPLLQCGNPCGYLSEEEHENQWMQARMRCVTASANGGVYKDENYI